MPTIREDIEAWHRTVKGASLIASNTEVHNHLEAAVAELLTRPWVNIVIAKDMQIKSPAEALGRTGDQTST